MVNILLQVATFTSAFLLFIIQPLYAKHLLPFFGGTATVWTISIFFYSVTLLLGYIYATFITEWKIKGVMLIHGLLLSLAAGVLIFRYLGEGSSLLVEAVITGNPAISVLLTLLFAVGLPVLLLASTSVITQRLYARSVSGEPYRLYAVSNIGSVMGLLSYPFIVEPFSTTTFQIFVWMCLFIIFSLALLVAWRLAVLSEEETVVLPSDLPTRSLPDPKLVLILAAIPTFLLASGTEYLSQGIASFPLMWVVPLTLYLLSFVVSFSSHYRWFEYFPVTKWVVAMSVPVIVGLPLMNVHASVYWYTFFVFSLFFFFTSVYFHRWLYDLRPEVSKLGRFYILMTAGGAIGSGVVGLVLPFLLRDNIELPVVAGLLVVYFSRLYFKPEGASYPAVVNLARLSMTTLGLLFVLFSVVDTGTVDKERNFYGVLHVLDIEMNVGGEKAPVRVLVNGATVHGLEAQDEQYQSEAVSYYGADSGIDVAMRSFTDQGRMPRVMVVGLGAGMINSYCDEVEHISYIEINPAVLKMAREYFTYLDKCPEKNDIKIGDGRLLLQDYANAEGRKYDVIMVDAFTDDAIPAHLLTVEAFEEAYKPLLTEDGVLAIHTTNKYLDLSSPIVGMISDDFAALKVNNFPDGVNGLQLPTSWILITKKDKAKNLLEYETVSTYEGSPIVWTDNMYSIINVLSLSGSF